MPPTLTPAEQAEHAAVLATLAGDDTAAIADLYRAWHHTDLRAIAGEQDGGCPAAISTHSGGALTLVRDIAVSAAARDLAAAHLARRAEGTDLARRALAAIGHAYDGTSGWWISAFATPKHYLGFVNIAKGIAAVTSVTLSPGIIEALTAPGQPEGPQVSGAAAWTAPDPGEAHHAAAPDGWVQLLCDLRGGRDLPPLHGISATLTTWCLATCYGRPGEPGWTRLDPPQGFTDPWIRDLAAAAGWPHSDPRDWPASGAARAAMDDAGRAALEQIARQLAAEAGLAAEVGAALDGPGPAWQRVRAAIGAVPRDPRASQVPPEWTAAEVALRDAMGLGSGSAVPAALRDAGITRLAWACGDVGGEDQVSGSRMQDLIRVLLSRVLRTRLLPVAEAVTAQFPAGSERINLSEGETLTAFLFPSARDLLVPAVTSLAGRVLAPCTVTAKAAVAGMLAIYAAGGPVTVSLPLPMPGPWPGDEPVGLAEIAVRLGVERGIADQWRTRGTLPPPAWPVGGRPAWKWETIREWARGNGRWPWPR